MHHRCITWFNVSGHISDVSVMRLSTFVLCECKRIPDCIQFTHHAKPPKPSVSRANHLLFALIYRYFEFFSDITVLSIYLWTFVLQVLRLYCIWIRLRHGSQGKYMSFRSLYTVVYTQTLGFCCTRCLKELKCDSSSFREGEIDSKETSELSFNHLIFPIQLATFVNAAHGPEMKRPQMRTDQAA